MKRIGIVAAAVLLAACGSNKDANEDDVFGDGGGVINGDGSSNDGGLVFAS